jgi:hypothetical protein
MAKKGLAVLCVAVLISLASAAFAETEITLFSFEDQMPGFGMAAFDGYVFISAGDPEYGSAVTHGNYAMAVDLKDGWTQGLHGGVGFNWDWKPYFPALSDAWASGGKLRIDVTTNNTLANVPMDSGIQLALFIQGESNADPGQFGYTLGYRLIDSVYYTPVEGGPTLQTSTLEWDLTVDSAGNPTWFPSLWTEEDGGWADLRFHTNVIGGATNAGIIIIDNIRIPVCPPDNCMWGDFNQDNWVDLADYTVWADNFGLTGPPHVHGDGNGDDVVDIADYTIWADNFHFGETAPPASVPEPATMTLLGLGAVALLRRK